jgi:hypothetical protein
MMVVACNFDLNITLVYILIKNVYIFIENIFLFLFLFFIYLFIKIFVDK